RLLTLGTLLLSLLVNPFARGDDVKELKGVLYEIPSGMGEKDRKTLKGVILHIDGAKEDKPTDGFGAFHIEFAEPKRAGQDVILLHKKVDYIIVHPDLKGRLRLPTNGVQVEVWMVKKGDRFVLTDQSIERFVQDAADASAKELRAAGERPAPDLAGELKKVAAEYRLSEKEVADRFREWVKTGQRSADLRRRGLAELAAGNYKLAEESFNAESNEHLQMAATAKEGAGDAASADGRYTNAIQYYDVALSLIDAKHDLAKWESVRHKLAVAKMDFGEMG